jgi:polyribonucleotide nucleotidyltransferase
LLFKVSNDLAFHKEEKECINFFLFFFFMSKQVFVLELEDTKISFSTGHLAQMANGSVVAQMGGTSVLSTATMSKNTRDIDFLPVVVNYNEKYYASGMIKSSRFIKRETRPSDDKILMGRVIDRQVRPLFPKHIRNDIQIMATVLSYDKKNEHDILSGIAASASLAISDIPWNGPTANVRVGMIDGTFVLNPTKGQREKSELNLIVATSTEEVLMIDADANQITEEKMLEAIEFGKKYSIKIAKFIDDIAKKIGKEKKNIPAPEQDNEMADFIRENYTEQMRECIFHTPGKLQRFARKDLLSEEAKEAALEKFGEERDMSQFYSLFNTLFGDIIRTSILRDDIRINGRKLDEIRPLSAEVGVLPQVHGSGVFQRGETQGLSVLTLAAPGNEQVLEGIEGEEKKRYMHHYNFPPFSVGECSTRLSTGNREIGHGALAEKSLEKVLPSQDDFPYTIRVVTEILQSNGSSSMASVCGSTLALMDGGVPITAPVAGIAMGLMKDKNTGDFKVLSDLQDEEDSGGDMDFKVAGTEKGIVAIQMDIKTDGISLDIFRIALDQAKKGRLEILKVMLSSLSKPREELSEFAPRLLTLKINPEKIREVIGKGGETINGIINATGVDINIEDDGTVVISSVDREAAEEAKQMVETIVQEPEVGKIYEATVMRIEEYGAFVEIFSGTQGLVHISLISNVRVEKVSDHLKVGQKVRVKLIEIDKMGRLRLSMKHVQ